MNEKGEKELKENFEVDLMLGDEKSRMTSEFLS